MRKLGDSWSVDEVEYAEDLLQAGKTFEEIAVELYQKFGVRRNRNGVKTKLYKESHVPRVKIPEGKCYWTFKGKPMGKKHWLWKGVYQYE